MGLHQISRMDDQLRYTMFGREQDGMTSIEWDVGVFQAASDAEKTLMVQERVQAGDRRVTG